MDAILTVMVGLPGSGKSSLVKKMQADNNGDFVAISSDEYREKLFGDVNEQSKNTDLFEIIHRDIRENIKQGKDVVFDATNISLKHRMNLIKDLDCVKICLIMATPFEVCVERDKSRDRTVGHDVIKRMRENFVFPCYFEGWDEILIRYHEPLRDRTNKVMKDLYVECYNFDQMNKHHKYSLGEHMDRTYKYLLDTDADKATRFAGKLHDCGKLHCQTFTNKKGEPCESAHYYNHQNISAYNAMLLLRYFQDDSFTIDVCSLIQYHMQPYFNTSTKSKNKWEQLWGAKFTEKLYLLHEADKSSH